jgi:hypothetical protein
VCLKIKERERKKFRQRKKKQKLGALVFGFLKKIGAPIMCKFCECVYK